MAKLLMLNFPIWSPISYEISVSLWLEDFVCNFLYCINRGFLVIFLNNSWLHFYGLLTQFVNIALTLEQPPKTVSFFLKGQNFLRF